MTTKFVDTNIFLDAYLRRGMVGEKCKQLLLSDQKLFTTWLVIGEFEWVLRSFYELEKSKVVDLLSSIINLPNMEIPDKRLLSQAIHLFETVNIDWTDCLNSVLIKIILRSSV